MSTNDFLHSILPYEQNDLITNHSGFDSLSDIEVSVIVRKEIEDIVSAFEIVNGVDDNTVYHIRRSSFRDLVFSLENPPIKVDNNLKQRVKNIHHLDVNSKCDIWSLLHMGHPLIFEPFVNKFRENERELFLTLAKDVLKSIKLLLYSETDYGTQAILGPDEKLELPSRIEKIKRPMNLEYGETLKPDNPELMSDMELVVNSCKTLHQMLTDNYFMNHPSIDILSFEDKIRLCDNVSMDIRHKLLWVIKQRDTFFVNRYVNNFKSEKARKVFINVVTDTEKVLKPRMEGVEGDNARSDKIFLVPMASSARQLSESTVRLIKMTFFIFMVVLTILSVIVTILLIKK